MEIIDAPITSKIEVYNPIAAGIALMMQKHGAVLTEPIVVNGDAEKMATAKEGRKELKKFRTSLEAARKAEKAESLAYGRLVDSEAARIGAIALPLELAYDKSVTDEETRLDAIREAELQVEQKRIDGHRARIHEIKGVVAMGALCRTSERLQDLINGMAARMVEGFEEFQPEADAAHSAAVGSLNAMLAIKKEDEKRAADLKAQQEDLARQREAQAVAELKAAQERAAAEAADMERRKQADADLARQREAFALEQKQAQQKLDEQAAVIAEQQRVLSAATQPVTLADVLEFAPTAIQTAFKTDAAQDLPSTTPSAVQLIQAVAETFGVTMHDARQWLIERADEIQSI